MALAWTNKCCAMLNKKIRNKLFIDSINNSICNSIYNDNKNTINNYEGIEDIDEHFLVIGDKLLVKAPYYKYDHKIYSSSIIYIANLKKKQYKPLSFKEWCKLSIIIQENNANNAKNAKNISNCISKEFDICLESMLDDPKDKGKDKGKNKDTKSLFDYFDKDNFDKDKDNQHTLDKDKEIDKEAQQLLEYRILFYKYHNLQDVITADLYNFNDPISLKYNNITNNITNSNANSISLHEIKLLPISVQREEKYTIWHREVSTILFGIPNDRVFCKKCHFFIKKFSSHINRSLDNSLENSCCIEDMNNATEHIKLDMYLTNLATLTTSSKYITTGIPILDMNVQSNIECIENIKNIVRSSYEVKLILTKQEEHELKSINKILHEDESSGSTQKYITMSQMFGHYLNHIITSTYLEVDYGYALTVHKSQGSTYDDVFIEYSNLLANKKDTEKDKLLYTAITRCENKLHVYY
jgi:hypothetical protein